MLAFTDRDIRALVETGEYSDPRVVDYITSTLSERRDKMGQTYLSKVLPLDSFRVHDGELRFEDLAVKYGNRSPLDYVVSWSKFDNENGLHTLLSQDTTFHLPQTYSLLDNGDYLAARIHASADDRKTATVYLRKKSTDAEIVGVERKW